MSVEVSLTIALPGGVSYEGVIYGGAASGIYTWTGVVTM